MKKTTWKGRVLRAAGALAALWALFDLVRQHHLLGI